MNTIQTSFPQRSEFPATERLKSAVTKGNEAQHKSPGTGDIKEASSRRDKPESVFDVSKLSEEEKEKLEAELKKLNDSIASSGKLLRFRYDEEAETSYVEVVDTETQEVVASLPPEFLIDLSVRMKEILGMFIDKKL